MRRAWPLFSLFIFIIQILAVEGSAGLNAARESLLEWDDGSASGPSLSLAEPTAAWGSIAPLPGQTNANLAKFSPALRTALTHGRDISFLVLLNEQADLSRVARLSSRLAKGRAVYDDLRAVARRTQAPLRAELDALGVEYRPFYIVNMLAVQGDAALALTLAARRDVARLEANPSVRVGLPAVELAPSSHPTQVNTVEWGLDKIQADEVWALGYTGQGIVVAGQDTGYDWEHPALKSRYRGWNGTTANHNYNWHDAIHSGGGVCGADSPEPCDDHYHGTHTMGTIVGDDGGSNQIGVAPGARWIGCRNMDQGVGTPSTYAECFEFFLAPYPVGGDPMTDGDPDLAPHVINNSWTCPSYEGCDVDSLRTAVENVRAAGIAVVVSAGNSGPSCGTVNAPPALHDVAFTIGATDGGDRAASFSGRGPVAVDGSNRPKPDVSAPGVGVRSSMPGGDYGNLSGTSMAAPHVTGLVALLWSATPQLIGNVDLTETLVQQTARPVVDMTCGGDANGHPNNVYGFGIVDALASITGNAPSLEASVEVQSPWVDAGGIINYTFTVSNTAELGQATDVTLTDILPLSTTFAQASGVYSLTDDHVTWSLGTISAAQRVTATLAVTVASDLAKGTSIFNTGYSVRSSQIHTPVVGAPAMAVIPWRYFLPIALPLWPWFPGALSSRPP